MNIDDLIAHAVALSEELGGAPVFPVKVYPDPKKTGKLKKEPLVEDWPNGGSATHPDEIEKLFAYWPNATNVGVITGQRSRLLLVDLDGPAGEQWWREHADILPATRTQRTQRADGGRHLIYRVPVNCGLRNTAGQVATGVDTRGDGGYICDWSMLHPPEITDVTDAPAELIDLLRQAQERGKSEPGAKPNGQDDGKLSEGMRNDFLSNKAFALRKQGLSLEIIEAALQEINHDRCEPPLPDDEICKIAAGKDRIEPDPLTSRPVVRLRKGTLHHRVDEAEREIADELYLRGGVLVRLGKSIEIPTAHKIERSAEQSIIVPANVEYLRRELTRRVCFQQLDGRGNKWSDVDCPYYVAGNIVNVAQSPHWRPLTAIARAPFLRGDFSVCETPGYDSATGIYYEPTEDFPPVLQVPSKAEAEAALKTLRAPFRQFPFTPGSESVFLTHILTATMRASLSTSPLFVYSAPTAGHGKTLLCRAVTIISTGNEPAIRPYVGESEEQRKVLFSSLLAGDANLLIDNIPNGTRLRSPTLCAFVTSVTYGDRALGTSNSTTLPNTLLVSATGNNTVPCGDLARRSLVCRLDCNRESARGRPFDIADLCEYVRQRRPELLVAALTILRAYHVAGSPAVKVTTMESFEGWARAVRDPLVWLSMSDPLGTQEAETDDETSTVLEVFTELHKLYGTGNFTAAGIVGEMSVTAALLREALTNAGCSDVTKANRIGYWLRANRDRVAGGWKLVNRQDTDKKTAVWRLKSENTGDNG